LSAEKLAGKNLLKFSNCASFQYSFMTGFAEAELETLIIHQSGSKFEEQLPEFSKEPVTIEDGIIKDLLLRYFLHPFKSEQLFHFTHSSDVNLNEMYHYASAIFENPKFLYPNSINITNHLYNSSSHHAIKKGELYISYFRNCQINGEFIDCIGIFKSETKETYLKVFQQHSEFQVTADDGINIQKLDKGCLIFNREKEKGFVVAMVDTINKGSEAQYWKDNFLQISPRQDAYYYTNNYLSMCKNFCTEVLTDENNVEKPDQIEILNKSINYFSKKENFNVQEFENEVLQAPDLIDEFQGYRKSFASENPFAVVDEFGISQKAVNSSKKIFKSILKLDKNFHVYIHGNRENIIKGFDQERGMNYYQLFYNSES
jgi:hypothetical protein